MFHAGSSLNNQQIKHKKKITRICLENYMYLLQYVVNIEKKKSKT